MKIQALDNKTNFQQKMLLDEKIITRATREEKAQLASLKKRLKNNGLKGEIKISLNKSFSFKVSETEPKTSSQITNKNKSKITVNDIIEYLKSRFNGNK